MKHGKASSTGAVFSRSGNQEGSHILRERGGYVYRILSKGLQEGHFRAVKGLAADPVRMASVEAVPGQGMAQPGKMDSDLVGAASLQPDGD